MALLFWGPFSAFSAENPSVKNSRAVQKAEKAYNELLEKRQQNPTNAEIAWEFGRACFDVAEFAGHDSYRGHLADQGMAACRQAIGQNPMLAPAHYYLALNMGQKARSDKFGALRLLHEMEAEFKTAIALDTNLDYGGPDRSLGLLYRDAPGWPTSIGSRHKAREHLIKATQIAPNYPDNWLSLLEAYLRWGEKDKARELLPSVERKLQAVRQKFTGPDWEWSWQDWDHRWEKILSKTGVRTAEDGRK